MLGSPKHRGKSLEAEKIVVRRKREGPGKHRRMVVILDKSGSSQCDETSGRGYLTNLLALDVFQAKSIEAELQLHQPRN